MAKKAVREQGNGTAGIPGIRMVGSPTIPSLARWLTDVGAGTWWLAREQVIDEIDRMESCRPSQWRCSRSKCVMTIAVLASIGRHDEELEVAGNFVQPGALRA